MEHDHDIIFLKQTLDAAGTPALPPSLTAEALFARMDAGEFAAAEPKKNNVITLNWQRIGTVAAALAVVLGISAALQSGMMNGLVGGMKSAANESAAYDAEAPTAAPESPAESEPELYSEQKVTTDGYSTPAAGGSTENGEVHHSVNGGYLYRGEAAGPTDPVWRTDDAALALTEMGLCPLEVAAGSAGDIAALAAGQNWQKDDTAASAGYTFTVEDTEYLLIPGEWVWYDVTRGTSVVLSAADAEALVLLLSAN